MARLVALRIRIEKGEESVVENDHGLARGHDAAAAEAGHGPNDLARRGLEAHQLGGTMGRTVQRIEMSVDEDAGIEIPLHVLLLPDRRGFATGLWFDHDRARGGRDDDAVPDHDGIGGVDIAARLPRQLGGGLAGGGIKSKQPLRGEQKAIGGRSTGFVGHDGGVAGGLGRGKPDRLAGFLVQRDAAATDVEKDAVAVDESRTREAPLGQLHLVIGDEVAAPEDLAVVEIKLQRVTLLAERVDRALMDRRGRAGSAFVIERIEGTGIGMLPDHFAGLRGKTPDRIGFLFRDGAVAHRHDLVAGHRDCAEAGADLGGPGDG